MYSLVYLDAPLVIVPLISLIEYISRALAVAASRPLWESFVLLGSKPLWVRLLSCAVCFLSCLFWDSIFFVRVPAFLRPYHPLCVFAFLSRLLWDSFCFVRVPPSLCLSPLSLCFYALLSRLLRNSLFWVLAYPGPFPSYLEMHSLVDLDATLDSVVLISLIYYI